MAFVPAARIAWSGLLALGLAAAGSSVGLACRSDKRTGPFDVMLPGGAARVSLVDPGTEPRRLMQFRYVAGAHERATLKTQLTLSLDLGEGRGPMPAVATPPTQFVSEIGVTGVAPDGTATFVEDIATLGISREDPATVELAEDLARALQATGATRYAGEIGPDGRRLRFEAQTGPSLAPEAAAVARSLDQASMGQTLVLPGAAIGVGATWELDSDVSFLGLTLPARVTYRLVALRSDGGTYVAQWLVQAANQTLRLPGVSSSAAVEVRSLELRGTSSGRFDLRQVRPVSENGTYTIVIRARATSGSRVREVRMTGDLTTELTSERVEPVEGAAAPVASSASDLPR